MTVRKLIGGLVFVGGVGLIGGYGSGWTAKDMERDIRIRAGEAVQGSTHGIEAIVTGRDIRVTGLADSESERVEYLAIADAIDGRRIVTDDLEVLPTISPYVFETQKTTRFEQFGGMAPNTDAQDAINAGTGTSIGSTLPLAAGAPDGYVEAVSAAYNATTALIEGAVRIEDETITLKGLAFQPPERDAALAALQAAPENYILLDQIELFDDGTPFQITMTKVGDEITGNAKLPQDMGSDRVFDALDAGSIQFGGTTSRMASERGLWPDAATTALSALNALETGVLAMEGTQIVLTGQGTPSAKANVEAMIAALPTGFEGTTDIKVLDDGKPFALSVDYDGANATASGKLPANASPSLISGALGATPNAAGLNRAYIEDVNGAWVAMADTALGALRGLENGALEIVGNDVTLTGVGSPSAITAAQDALAEYRGATADLGLYDDGAPFRLIVENDGETVAAIGKLPSDAENIVSEAFSGADTNGVATAFITDPKGVFPARATAGLTALSRLENGKLVIEGDTVTLSGLARTLAESGLADQDLVTTGATVSTEYTYLDDGSPAAFNVVYDASGGAVVSGKLPAGVTLESIAAALNLEEISGTPTQGLLGDADVAQSQLEALAGWLPEMENASFAFDGSQADVGVTLSPGVDAELVAIGMSQDLGGETGLELGVLETLPAAGASRVNLATGQREVFQGGFWLPQTRFAVAPAVCQGQTEAALSRNKVNFLSAQARLDGRATRAVNDIAAVALRCVSEGNLKVEIGGHTDSSGDAAANDTLSAARAETVRNALILRGVPEGRITAIGFGASHPIASNDTDEGKAANRRTTIIWSQP
jgi:OOP family OmpA-OmpF porin